MIERLSPEEIKERYNWKPLEPPKAWRPREPGEELIGYYGGRSRRRGKWGEYEVVLVAVPGDGVRMVSGVKIIQLFDAATVEPGQPVIIRWLGDSPVPSKPDQTMKHFEVFVTDGERIPADHLPTAAARA